MQVQVLHAKEIAIMVSCHEYIMQYIFFLFHTCSFKTKVYF